jgi:hypothetical protein
VQILVAQGPRVLDCRSASQDGFMRLTLDLSVSTPYL